MLSHRKGENIQFSYVDTMCNNSAKIEKNNETLLVYTKDAHLVTPQRGSKFNVNKIAKMDRLLNYGELHL